MALKKGDIIDERKRYPDSCGLLVKVMAGGEGFEKLMCCGHELTEEDVVASPVASKGRKKGRLVVGMTLEEKKLFPDSCGLRLMVMDGGAGFQEILCCNHSVNDKAMQDLNFGGGVRTPPAEPSPNTSHTGNA
ncbi:MAG: hypothetical protein MRJ96_04815 [Nitrospirales bacterium]|nr:hypothetical protein [Nitrospira sp.]MDR4500762.1 hypothetical protein [Nitrospirales bacterium]